MRAFSGGMEFRQGRQIRLPPPPVSLPAHPMRLVCPERPEVIVGQVVRQGQLLLDPARPGRTCRVSPVTGTVREVRQVQGPSLDGDESGYEIVIEPSMREVPTALETAPPAAQRLDLWLSVMRQAGPWSDHDGGVGLLPQLETARERKPETVICVGLDAFPPCPDRSSLLVSFPEEVVQGTMVVADLVGAKNVILLAHKAASVLGRVRSSCRRHKARLKPVVNIYPSADPTLVAWSHAHERLPHGANPVHHGLLLLTPWTVIRIARWISQHKLDVLRPMMIVWPEAGSPMSLAYALAGQPLSSIHPRLASGDAQAVVGNPMTGKKISGVPGVSAAVPDDELLITVLPPITHSRPEACISCGWCADVCPTSLRPVHLMQQAQHGARDNHLAQQLDWCIDCGLCSHVCPVSLPLAQTLRTAAGELRR